MLILYIVLFSYLVTLVLTAIQLRIDYNQGIDAIYQRIDQIQKTNIDSIRQSLWTLDHSSIDLQLDGLSRIRDITFVEINEADNKLISSAGYINTEELLAFKKQHGTVVGMPSTMTVSNEEILEIQCDILIPAALGNQIHAENAHRINAKLVVEAANGPTTPKADEILAERGIYLLPDIIANAGGVTVSYFEWVQNQMNQQWDIEEVNARLQKRMHKVVDLVFDRWQGFVVGAEKPTDEEGKEIPDGQKPDFRNIALSIAIERVANATLMRGIWP